MRANCHNLYIVLFNNRSKEWIVPYVCGIHPQLHIAIWPVLVAEERKKWQRNTCSRNARCARVGFLDASTDGANFVDLLGEEVRVARICVDALSLLKVAHTF